MRHGKPETEMLPVSYPAKRGGKIILFTVLGLLLAVGISVAVVINTTGGGKILSALGITNSAEDYTGNGHGSAQITVRKGDTGVVIARALEKAGVIKTAEAFMQYLLEKQPDAVFDIGTYKLKKGMNSQAAFLALQDPANKVQLQVTIPEGYTLYGVFNRLAKATGIEVASFNDAAANYVQLGVPKEFPSLEGFLFPATYTFTPEDSAADILEKMVARMWQALREHGVSEADAYTVLTKAALIQREAGQDINDFGKIARVFENRLAKGMRLESDATVAYGAGSYESVWTTPEQRADTANLYNTYAHTGLPLGPIGAPGDAAITAALNPTPGNWLYFVTVNFETGATKFSETFAEHEQGVEQLASWCRAHRAAGGKLCD